MKKNDKKRLFEVMGRLDKTFKPSLNEGFEEIETTDNVDVPAEAIPTDIPTDEPVEEKSPEEKLAELTAKVDELHAMLHGETENDETEEVPSTEPEEIEVTTGDVGVENLQEWNFDKKKGEEHEEKADDKKEDEKEEKEEVDEAEEKKEKIPVAAVAKVGK